MSTLLDEAIADMWDREFEGYREIYRAGEMSTAELDRLHRQFSEREVRARSGEDETLVRNYCGRFAGGDFQGLLKSAAVARIPLTGMRATRL